MDQNSGNSSLWFCDFIHSKFCFRQKLNIMQKSDRKEQLSNFREYLKTKETCHLRAIVCNFRIFFKKSRPPNFTDMAEIWHEGWF